MTLPKIVKNRIVAPERLGRHSDTVELGVTWEDR